MAALMASCALARSSLWGSRLTFGSCTGVVPAANGGTFSRPGLLVEAKKRIEGKVTSDCCDKTVTVEVTRIAPDPKYKKRVRHTKKYHAHDPDNTCKIGDVVTLAVCAPVSKTKKFLVVGIKGKQQSTKAVELPPLQSVIQEQEIPGDLVPA